jgi:hypothetical protein
VSHIAPSASGISKSSSTREPAHAAGFLVGRVLLSFLLQRDSYVAGDLSPDSRVHQVDRWRLQVALSGIAVFGSLTG